jgi:hypothetical protein
MKTRAKSFSRFIPTSWYIRFIAVPGVAMKRFKQINAGN